MASHNTRFFYGPGRSRYKRLDTETADGGGGITTTRYVGSVEILLKPNGSWEKKRYIGGVLVITLNSDGGGAKEYLFTDHLGSTDVLAHRFGNELQRMGFDAFGARRNPIASNAPTPWGTLTILAQLNFDTSHTTHGYTGHEGADKVGLIHMNGRMYDPVLGRFIQADSIVQDPFDPQSLNRYAYVQNNPLSATDPSGNISFKNALRLGISIGIAVYTGGTASTLLAHGIINGFQAVAIVAAGGALSGAVSGGGLKGAVRGAFTAAVFFGVGQGATALQGPGGTLRHAAFANNGLGRAALHGIAGGALASLQGGNFGHGFLTAGVGKAVTSRVALTGNDLGDGAIAALVGGTLSEASGDSFTNGALTGAMQFAFNQLFDPNADEFDPEKCRNAGCTNPRFVNANQAAAEGFDKTADVLDELAVDQAKYAWLGPLAGPVARFVRATRGFFRFGMSVKRGANFSRELKATDLGLKGALQEFRGTFTLQDGAATMRIDMIRGELQNPLQVVNNMVASARANGATSLRIEGTIANERLFNVMQQRYGLTSSGATDFITIPLR